MPNYDYYLKFPKVHIFQFALRNHANSRVDLYVCHNQAGYKNPVLEAEGDQKCPSSMLYIVL